MILIVDDDVAMAETCCMYLESQGFDVAVASNGAQALQQIHSALPELVISDCAMPEMTGLELSETMKADPSTAEVPILLMSGSMRCEVAKGSSYEGFLRKPFLAEVLLAQVRKLLDGKVHIAGTCAGH